MFVNSTPCVIRPCLCSPNTICSIFVGRCIAVNGESARNMFMSLHFCALVLSFGCLCRSLWLPWGDFGRPFGSLWAAFGSFGLSLASLLPPFASLGAAWVTYLGHLGLPRGARDDFQFEMDIQFRINGSPECRRSRRSQPYLARTGG